jgi:MerR family transcriptional regulator, light-induced transcriptional regulator
MNQIMIEQKIYDEYYSHLIHGNKRFCSSLVDSIIKKQTSVEIIYTNLFQKALYKVGEDWEMNRISVATEHMATAITESMMIRLQPQLFSAERTGNKAVIACVANEYHQVGAKMVADMFEMNGWDGYFIGANTPFIELIRFIESQKPDLIGLSLSIYFNIHELKNTLEQIHMHFPDTPIIVGGQAFRWGGHEIADQYNHVSIITSIPQLNQFILNFDKP